MSVINNTVVTIQNNHSYKLMDQAVQIENHLANRGNSHPNSEAWQSANDVFNELRGDYCMKSYKEAVNDAKFTLQASSNPEDHYFAELDLRALKRINGAKYVVMGNSEKQSYVPATANNDIIPFLRCLKQHDSHFKSIKC